MGKSRALRDVKSGLSFAALLGPVGWALRPIAETMLENLGLADEGDELQTEYCTIHDVFAHTGCYALRTGDGRTRYAYDGTDGGGLPIGVRRIGHFLPGTRVKVEWPPKSSTGIIIRAVPPAADSPEFLLPDAILPRSNVGMFRDPVHHGPALNKNFSLPNYSEGRPVDSLPGDWGYMNELALMFFMGRTRIALQASELAGIEAFWGDDLLRLCAYNLQLCTAGGTDTRYDDQGEYVDIRRWSPFPWEAQGAFARSKPAFRTTGEDGKMKIDQEVSPVEPQRRSQMGVPRFMQLGGYLGDLHRTMVILPPTTGKDPGDSEERPQSEDPNPDVETLESETNYRGLAEVTYGPDGGLYMRSAREIVLSKTVFMPVPKQIAEPDSPGGDDETSYKAAGAQGAGDKHKKDAFEWKSDWQSLELMQYHAYLFNLQGPIGLVRHEKDWHYPEQPDVRYSNESAAGDGEDPGDKSQLDIKNAKHLARLKHDFVSEQPEFTEIEIDHREGHKSRFSRTQSMFALGDDGSVTIEDGWGSQIIMAGGNINLTCPGDVLMRPGRSVIALAPHDVIARAGNNVEISSTTKDVKIKAKRNVHSVSGVDEDGGRNSEGSILLECRAEGKFVGEDWKKVGDEQNPTGVVIKSDKAPAFMFSKEVFLGIHQDEDGTEADGLVTINAGKGKVFVGAKHIGLEATQQIKALVSKQRSADADAPMFTFDSNGFRLRGNFSALGDGEFLKSGKDGGNLLLAAALQVKGKISTENICHANNAFTHDEGFDPAARETNPAGKFQVSPKPPQRSRTVNSDLDNVRTNFANGFDFFDVYTFSSKDAPGLGATVKAVRFSFRSDEQLKVDKLVLQEARWQQYLVARSEDSVTWDETPVKSSTDTDTFPWPGKQWREGEIMELVKQGEGNFDYEDGAPKPRDELAAAGSQIEKGIPKDKYVVTLLEPEK